MSWPPVRPTDSAAKGPIHREPGLFLSLGTSTFLLARTLHPLLVKPWLLASCFRHPKSSSLEDSVPSACRLQPGHTFFKLTAACGLAEESRVRDSSADRCCVTPWCARTATANQRGGGIISSKEQQRPGPSMQRRCCSKHCGTSFWWSQRSPSSLPRVSRETLTCAGQRTYMVRLPVVPGRPALIEHVHARLPGRWILVARDHSTAQRRPDFQDSTTRPS